MCTYSPKNVEIAVAVRQLYNYYDRSTKKSGRSNSNASLRNNDLIRFTKYFIFPAALFYLSEAITSAKYRNNLGGLLTNTQSIFMIFSYFNKNFYRTKHNHCSKFLRHNLHSRIIFPTDSFVKLICRRRISDPHLYLNWNLSGGKYSLHKIIDY